MHIALTIAGSDSGGGAGIQADLKTFHQFGVFGTSAITAITAQNTVGVSAWQAVPVELVQKQIEAVASDLSPRAVKSGMLATKEIISVVAGEIRRFELKNYVLDPVMVATSGDLLIERDAVSAITAELIPLATVVTPNADEATVLTGIAIESPGDMRRAAERLMEMGARAVLLKGGHVRTRSGEVVDLLFDGEFSEFTHSRVETKNTHGTGCTLSAAIAANLALGLSLHDAVGSSIEFVHEAIATAPDLGSGHGPLNHFVSSAATNSRTSA
ncbi:MAG TPA: bifunctional hydroxymethylpyrimidine kinase/phosphomethylpyrimidine kinase [Gemmatimonadaceae bacterium]|nr:bifunctional hydroxymethylpyrimidine kinase/phosphomethylpyrimidine kinase [Gemmatimonadaceae bacterium]